MSNTWRPIGRVLIKMGVVRKQQVEEALEIQKSQKGSPLGKILVDAGHVTDEDLFLALVKQRDLEMIGIGKLDVPSEVTSLMTAQMANTYRVVPYDFDPDTRTMSLVMDDPDNFLATDELQTLLGFHIKAAICTKDDLQKALDRYYQDEEESIATLLENITQSDDIAKLERVAKRGDSIDLDELKEVSELAPIQKLINLVLLQAIKEKASDIHFEPFEDECKMRYRVDGVLHEMVPPPIQLAPAIASRIKVMAELDIAERRLPQDGRIELQFKEKPIDLRVSVLPTLFGESVVLRVLDRGNIDLSLDKIGMNDDELAAFRQLIQKPNGVIINTGPTGSGKTSTLYAALSELNKPGVKILTAEDPVEYDVDGLVQIQVRPKVGLTFARALRSFLRQDPDIILVGEIRDLETAQVTAQAALTGHLVFSTLHTNDAPSAIARLLDLGLEPFLITATLEAIVAQRLVRRICTSCKTAYTPTEDQLMEIRLRPEDVDGKVFYYGVGCDYCNKTGYRGRIGIYETMVLDDGMRNMIMDSASTTVLRQESIKRGMRTLRESGLKAIFNGITSIDEVVKETIFEE